MITHNMPDYRGGAYRVLVLNLQSQFSTVQLTATLAELKKNGVLTEETVVMDVGNSNVLPILLSGAIRTRAYDVYVVIGVVDALPNLVVSKLFDVACWRANPVGIGFSVFEQGDDSAQKTGRQAVKDAIEIANSVDTINEY